MAIDPLTAKLAAQATQAVAQALADEEKRRNIILTVCIAVSLPLCLIMIVFYILTSPLSLIAGFFSDTDLLTIISLREQTGLEQLLGEDDWDYLDGYGQSYEGVIIPGNVVDVVYYNQLDERWADLTYGLTGSIGREGCGPTALSMIVSSLSSDTYDPAYMAAWAAANGHRCEGNGSYHSIIPDGARAFGLTVEGLGNANEETILDALGEGKLIGVLMSKGHFTNSGHFIVLRGVTEEGKILVADPASWNRSEQEWDLEIILSEARQGASSGGPFWAVGE